MDKKTDPNINFISNVLEQYSVGKLLGKPILLKGDTLDVNYKITNSLGNSYFLKCVSENRDVRFWNFLGDLHYRLRFSGVPVPNIYKNNSGGYVTNYCLLFEFMPGKAKKNWTNQETGSAALNLAKMHRQLEKIDTPSFIRNQTDNYIRCEDINFNSQYVFPKILSSTIDNDIKKEISATITELDTGLSGYKFSKHIIHGDFGEGNALFNKGKLTAIIDLTLRYDSLIYDLGVNIFWTCVIREKNKRINLERYKQIITSYQHCRRLSQRERRMLPYFILRRSCATFFYSWQKNASEDPISMNVVNQQMKEIAIWNKGIRDNVSIMSEIIETP